MRSPYGGSPPHVGCDTSRDAALSVAPILGKLQERVLAMIRTAGRQGCTCDEIETATGMRHQSASPRVRELYLKGLIVDSGDRRRTRSKRNAKVWIVPGSPGQQLLFT